MGTMTRGRTGVDFGPGPAAVLVLAALWLWGAIPARAQDRLPADFAYEVAVEKRLEERLNTVLSEIAGEGRVLAVVDAEVAAADVDLAARARMKEKDVVALPGVPVKKKFGTDVATESMEGVNVLNRLIVTLLVDRGMDDAQVDVLRETTKSVIGFVEERGDLVDVRRVTFENRLSRWASVLYPPQIYWVFIVTAVVAFLVSATVFLSNPFKKLGGALAQAGIGRGSGGGGEGSGAAPTIETHNVFQTAPPPEAPGSVDGETPLPFAFIEERHLPGLATLLARRSTEEAAIVANYLKPELTAALLDRFPEDRQVAVAALLGRTRELEPAEVRALEDDLKARLDFLMGDEDRLVALMDQVPDAVREGVLSSLAQEDPDLAIRVRRRVKDFETMLRDLTPASVPVLLRHVDPALFARLLKGVPEDLYRGKILGCLSAGAAERLQQEVEMSAPVPEARLVRERRQVVSLIRRLLQEGLIEEEEAA